MDNSVKKREWVKTAAIIFLSVLLVLTFFSNTIMNRTLPEVSTAEVTDGNITAKVKGTGTVSARGNTEIKSNATTTVASVKIKEGQEVAEGDTLFVLGEQSEELKTAEEKLSNLEYELQTLQVSYPSNYSNDVAVNRAYSNYLEAQSAADGYYNSYMSATVSEADLIILEERLAAAETALNNASKDVENALIVQENAHKAYDDDPTSEEKKKAYEDAQAAYTDAQSKEKIAKDQYHSALSCYNASAPQSKTTLYNAYVAAQAEADKLYDTYVSALDTYNISVDTYNRSVATTNVDINKKQTDIAKLKAEINELKGGEGSKGITAPVAGTIASVSATAGQSIAKGDVLCTIEVPDQGYQISFSVTNDQAKRLKVGDSATVTNFYWGSEVTATVSSIKTDTKNPQTNKTIVCDLEGDDISSGSQMTVAIGSKSASYDTIVPKSAVRTDSNGTYVLAIESKTSALGNRYYAKRVDVEQLATDDVNVAVSGNISYGDFVITTSSEKISANAQVRMADTQ